MFPSSTEAPPCLPGLDVFKMIVRSGLVDILDIIQSCNHACSSSPKQELSDGLVLGSGLYSFPGTSGANGVGRGLRFRGGNPSGVLA